MSELPDSHSGSNARFSFDSASASLIDRLDCIHTKRTVGVTAAILNVAAQSGYLDLLKIRWIADFGAGAGGSTLPLAQLARQNHGSVAALELRHSLADRIVRQGILPSGQVHIGNGLEFLERAGEQGRSFDLVNAAMLDPSLPPEQLFAASGRALGPEGSLVIRSDGATMASARVICGHYGIEYAPIEGVGIPVQSTLIIAAAALRSF